MPAMELANRLNSNSTSNPLLGDYDELAGIDGQKD
jgi:hypothetical protein